MSGLGVHECVDALGEGVRDSSNPGRTQGKKRLIVVCRIEE